MIRISLAHVKFNHSNAGILGGLSLDVHFRHFRRLDRWGGGGGGEGKGILTAATLNLNKCFDI